jgi:hypothetical protein
VKKIFLDARQMEHPEPLERAIGILREINDESYLYMLHRKNPVPLIALAKEHHLNTVSEKRDGKWHILISPNSSIDLNKLIETISA